MSMDKLDKLILELLQSEKQIISKDYVLNRLIEIKRGLNK